ncbi:MAG: hypothetical protein ACR2L8_14565 [Solirubrobacteraceae bacterium]
MKRSKAVNLAVVPLLAAAFSACGSSQDEEVAYCVDKDDKVVENRYCDGNHNDGGGGFFFFYGAGGLGRGARVPSGGERINAADRAAFAQRGGFGASASDRGVGRATGRAVGGGSFSSGG